MNVAAVRPMSVTEQVRAAIERVLPWFDPSEHRRVHRVARKVIADADRVIDARTDRAHQSYRAYGRRVRR